MALRKPRRIGFGHPWGRELSRWLNTETVDTPGPHIVDRNLQLLRPLRHFVAGGAILVPECSAARQRAAEMIAAAGLEQGFAIINTGAGWPSKLWPAARFAAVAAHLGAAWHLPTLVVWAGRAEQEIGLQIVAAARVGETGPAHNAAGAGRLARRAKLFISSDTGPLHLAAAVDTPCVGLFGPWPAEVHGPYRPWHIALQKARFAGSTRGPRPPRRGLMEAITVADVCQACDQISSRTYKHAVGVRQATG